MLQTSVGPFGKLCGSAATSVGTWAEGLFTANDLLGGGGGVRVSGFLWLGRAANQVGPGGYVVASRVGMGLLSWLGLAGMRWQA